MSGNVYDELKERGFVAQVSDETAVRKMLEGKPITFYVGFDSTASPPHRGRSQTWVRFPSRAERNANHFPSKYIVLQTMLSRSVQQPASPGPSRSNRRLSSGKRNFQA
jgi:hypothetical protein